jgi:septal ring factor EnvC (AmiA/AmiB activator)
MRTKATILVLLMASVVSGDTYSTLIQRYEIQIKQQEKHLRSLRRNLQAKQQEAVRWQQKAEAAKTQWTQAGLAAEQARKMVRIQQQRRARTHTLAEAAEWSVIEHTSMGNAANQQATWMVTEYYKQQQVPHYFSDSTTPGTLAVMENLAALSQTRRSLAEKAQIQEASLRFQEMRWQNEANKQSLALDEFTHLQQTVWLHWQEALQKQKTLEEERRQLEQSAQAMRVMLGELREHRDQVVASKTDAPRRSAALTALRGTLPWPVTGMVTQNFGKHYNDKLQQLIISNGIRVEAETGKPVRTVQAGKVLFARPFQQYGQLVIIQHQHGLTSVYGELGQTQVKEGDVLSALDAVGTIGKHKSFYFELRHEEEPINPLVWLAPQRSSELSSTKKFE